MVDYYRLVGPLVRMLDAETAHGLTVRLLEAGVVPSQPRFNPPALRVRLWGRDFANPIGLAAGFDKNAQVPDAMLAQGFGFVEIGSVTPRPQPGNPKPRMFRLPEDEAVINRMGFNNEGVEAVRARLSARRRVGVVGANLGKNKDTEDAAADYEIGAARLASVSDYLVINVSSPNTPGLRALQGRDQLESLVGRTRAALLKAMPSGAPPLLLKIAPDLAWEDLADIAAVALSGSLDGLIVSNTTVARPETLRSANAKETGGLSGAPLFEASTAVLRRMYELTQGKLPIIGVGGIASGSEAYAKIRAGASLVQLYSAMVYHGPGLVTRIKHDLLDLLSRDGFSTIAEAVGVDHRETKP
ncbi:dihydroorotate dehydrogenase [Paramagnetospirillum marisnigri]|uniref:Dihydroorotate dehydrogenase (quinone) n=1 Tax=Paramagnetospirillum marisnigri TaxID=1285242 RepID=A0A178MQ30_9PROT|nr:quinone-dependent dihydroorotate dehydrogenase [Paramagnetospirillum marisnigri]OAN50185.1 dihydroorotate dehydrogenase [Paramagnetospirillum marisnigri]